VAAGLPVRRPNGEKAGITTIVIPLSRVLNQRILIHNITEGTKVFMAYLMERPDTGELGARIFAREEHADFQARSWRKRVETHWLYSKDETQFKGLIQDIRNDTNNIRRMHYNGEDALWAYGPISNKAFLAVITPYNEILEPARKAEASVKALVDNLITVSGFGLLGIIILVIILSFAFSRTVTQPLQALVDGAMNLGKGKFETRVEIKSRDEFGKMGEVFNYVVPRLEEYYRISQSLLLAKEVQKSLLPTENPSIPGLDIAGQNIPCDETGGDYFDFIQIGENNGKKHCILVGDVSDHGLPSALLMASARAFIRQRASITGTLSEIVSDVNRQMARDVEDTGRFMTLFCSEIDMNEKTISWVRAGHDPGLFYNARTGGFEELVGNGMPLGIDEDAEYEESSKEISQDSIIVIGTDGIWETGDSNGKRFGKTRLQEIIRSHSNKSAGDILNAVIDSVKKFRHPLKQEDDVTLVIIKVT